MGNYIENLGLKQLVETEELAEKFFLNIARSGKPIVGYYNNPYFIKNYGTAEFVVRTIRNNEGFKRLEFSGFDTHTQGDCVWETRLSGASVDREDADIMEKRVIACNAKTGTGMACINLLNADVLPSYMADDFVKMQIIGFAQMIGYFTDEDEYADSLPVPEVGQRMLLGEGAVVAMGFLSNHNPDSDQFEKEPWLDDINLVRGTATGVYYGTFEVEEQKAYTYVRCIIDTEFGPLEIVHTEDQVREEQRQNMKEGATVFAAVVLSGDVAIDEYENGIVCDEKHDMALLRDTFVSGRGRRLVRRLADDCVYTSEAGKCEFTDKESIMDHFAYVKEQSEHRYFCFEATIKETDSDELDYPAGRRCLVLASDEIDHYESVAFIDYDENNLITRITLSTDSRYKFQLDPDPVYENDQRHLGDLNVSDDFYKRMIGRAECIMDIDCENVSIDNIRGSVLYREMRSKVSKRLAALMDHDYKDVKELTTAYKKLFGEVFAEAAHKEDSDEVKRIASGYYKDYALLYPEQDINEEYFREDMLDALVFVEMLGTRFGKMKEEGEKK